MKDQTPYVFQAVRPEKVYAAASYLTTQSLYKKHNIICSEDWLYNETLEQNEKEKETLIENEITNTETNTKNNTLEIEQWDNWDETINEETLNPGEEETLLQDEFIAMKFAPGENKKPLSLLMDENIEELSFPSIYCGKAREFNTHLTLGQIAKSEARMFDRRCAINIPKLMFSHCRL
ncbi:hypothetical protein KPH14_012582 [Odynerus spinipes]|uniref:Uncharacterized protein n=1 Tax=Odynerus spinipes TaxID=1348599 RepID=A0AAD9RFF3_9HYME|nr:hypothetical protein KPH14_012582 [Odynerus spinipes]